MSVQQQIVNRSFARRLLKQLHRARIRPYQLHDTLWLLRLLPSCAPRVNEVPSAAPRSNPILPPSDDTDIYCGVDAACNPAAPSQYVAIDVEGVYRRCCDEVRRALRADPLSALRLSSSSSQPPIGLQDFFRTMEQSKLLWLMRRLVNINDHPQRAPSASASGVCRSIFSTRSSMDTFPMASMFLRRDGLEQQQHTANNASRQTTTGAGVLAGAAAVSTLRLVAANLPTTATIHSEHFVVRITARHYEPKFVPHPSALEEDGSAPQATENRFLITVELTQQRTSCMRAVVVNSYVCALDLDTQVLSEVIGSLVNQADIPLLSKSEAVREKWESAPGGAQSTSGDDAPARRRTIPPLRTILDGNPAVDTATVSPRGSSPSSPGDSARDERSAMWQATWISSSDSAGPIVMRGTLHVKLAVCEDNASQETVAAALAAAPIRVFEFDPILLRCTL